MKNKGFTLIELMIVVAIIGILSAIAIPSYSSYMNTTRMGKVRDHANTAVRWIKEGFKMDVARRSMSIPYNVANEIGALAGNQSEFPRSAGNIINSLNDHPGGVGSPRARSPEQGLPAFSASPNVTAGQVGISISGPSGAGGAWLQGDTVVITPPAGYIDLNSLPITITYE